MEPQPEVLSTPALAIGAFLNVMITVSFEEVQGLLEIVQTKVTIACPLPAENPAMLTVEVGLDGVATDAPVPPLVLAIFQLPVPVVGVFPANVADVPQIVWSAPAFDVVGS